MITRFLLLAYGITWLAVSPLVLAWVGLGPEAPRWLHALGALGPLVAAVACTRGRSVFSPLGPSALSGRWIGVTLATPVIFGGIALATEGIRGSTPVLQLTPTSIDPGWLAEVVLVSLFYGLGEEPGWRGWLLPRLQERFPPVRATLLLTVVWALWHAPFFTYRFDFQGPGTLAGFFVGLLAGAFWLTFLFNSTGGSVWVVVVWHTLWNLANLSLAAVSDVAVAVLNALMMVLGFTILLVFGRRGLGLRGPVTRSGAVPGGAP